MKWQVKDYADGWIPYDTEEEARASKEALNGNLVRIAPVRPAPVSDETALERISAQSAFEMIKAIRNLGICMGTESGGYGIKIENNSILWRVEGWSLDSFSWHCEAYGLTLEEAWANYEGGEAHGVVDDDAFEALVQVFDNYEQERWRERSLGLYRKAYGVSDPGREV